jgi:succinate dehydrogenase / fumarate reductase flavoprotein subunit
MAYQDFLRDSVRKLEETRARRLGQEIPILTLPEKEELIKGFHPDYRAGGKRQISIGVNKGDLAPNELCDILEAMSLIDPGEVDLTEVRHRVDVLVVGGGGGGATAAYFAREQGADVLLATKLRFGDSNTIMAEGGINACVSPGDSPIRYYIDTMGGGGFTNAPDLVKALALDSPRILRWLENLGVPFDKEPDGTVPKATFRLGGGHSRPRVHSVGDYTGMAIMQTLRDEIQNKGIEVLEFSPIVDLLLDVEGRCSGALFLDIETRKPFIIKARKTILATGGLGRLHLHKFPTTNHYGATADGIVVGYRAGARLAYIDAVQFHPTGTAYPEQLIGLLVSEGLRGRGGHLVNARGERFINELETRDTVAAAIIREVISRKNGVVTPTGMGGVWLDVPVIDIVKGEGTIKRFLKHLCHRFMQYGIDITKEPILVYPAQHYQNGGLLSDENGKSTIENLYVVGEAAGGVHGRNRLGGNSLIDIFIFGRRAGIDAAQACSATEFGEITLDHVRLYNQEVLARGLDRGIKSPLLLPDYRYEKALSQVQL